MRNAILENLQALKARHYVVKGQPGTYWFQFYQRELKRKLEASDRSLYLIIYGSETEPDDYYVIPYKDVSVLFVPENLNEPSPGNESPRWSAKITGGLLKLDSSGRHADVAAYKANRHMLECALQK